MPRRPRLNFAGLPQHIVQRGNNRQPCFFADGDFRFYRHWLRLGTERYGCEIHAYALMTNHVRVLATPKSQNAVSRLMQSFGWRYVVELPLAWVGGGEYAHQGSCALSGYRGMWHGDNRHTGLCSARSWTMKRWPRYAKRPSRGCLWAENDFGRRRLCWGGVLGMDVVAGWRG